MRLCGTDAAKETQDSHDKNRFHALQFFVNIDILYSKRLDEPPPPDDPPPKLPPLPPEPPERLEEVLIFGIV